MIARLFNISLDYLLGALDDELALDRSNVVLLPMNFPVEVREYVLEYADLMVIKHGRKRMIKSKDALT